MGVRPKLPSPPAPSCRQARARGLTMQRPSVTMEAVRDLTSTLWTIRTNQETTRIYRTTQSLLRFFLFFDICYLISGIALVTMALANQMEERNRMVVYGGLFGLFASVSAICNFFASHGLRTWRRGVLLPWLFFFLLVIGLLTMNMIRDLWCHHIQCVTFFSSLPTCSSSPAGATCRSSSS